jgi:hypothetical protein
MKDKKVFKFEKKPLSRKELLLDDDILHEKNGFEELDDMELAQYMLERYGTTTLALLYGYMSTKKIKKLNKKEHKKHTKFKERGKKNKKNNIIDWYDDSNNYDDYGLTDKTIYYYRDINQPEDVEIFENLHEFDNFLNEEGIEMSDDEANKLMTRDISHCCLNPIDRYEKNRLRIMSSSSYGDLRFSNAELEYDII